jgi:N,N-dimethylformamidase
LPGATDAPERVADRSPAGRHAELVNCPTRAVTDHTWSGRQVDWTLAPDQYAAIHFHDDDLEDSGWQPDFALTVPDNLRSGIYAARLECAEGEEYIPFYVRPAPGAANAPVAFLAPTLTYLAYANERLYWNEGYLQKRPLVTPLKTEPPDLDQFMAEHRELGLSLYDVHSDGSGCSYSSCRRPILNMRPKYRAWRLHDAPRHFAADLYLIAWLEARGISYDVITDEDLHAGGQALLDRYRVVLTGSHPEYVTEAMHTAVAGYLESGGRLMYLGGNGFYWVTTIDPRHPYVIELRRGISGTRAWESQPGEWYHSTTGELGGLWRLRGHGPQRLLGVGFAAQGWGGGAGYVRQPASFDPRAAFIFDGIGPDEVIGDFGLALGGAAGDEIDRFDLQLGSPPHALLLATSAGRHTDYYQVTVEDVPIMVPGQGGTESPRVRADMVFFETPNGGAVFSVGSINWLSSLAWNRFDNNTAHLTGNVLRRFLDPRPFDLP